MSKLEQDNKIAIFEGDEIRKVFFDGEWYFVIEDVIKVLTDSKDPRQYIHKLRQRDEELSKGWVQIVHPLPIQTTGGCKTLIVLIPRVFLGLFSLTVGCGPTNMTVLVAPWQG